MITLTECPICKENDFTTILGFDYKPRQEIYKFLGIDNHKSNWSVCRNCAFLFQNPRAESEKIAGLYSSGLYRENREYSEDFFKARYERPLMHFKWAVKNGCGADNIKILDIGAGHGGAIKAFRDLGHDAAGVELDMNLCDVGRMRYDIKLMNSDILNAPLKEASFDLIYSAHVHEHFDDFQIVNERLFKLLKLNGMLLCILPTYRCSGSNGRGYINVFHNSIFTKTSLFNMFVNCGMNPVAFKYPFNGSMAEVWGLAQKRKGEQKSTLKLKKDNSFLVKKEINWIPFLFDFIYGIRRIAIRCYWKLTFKS